MTSQGANVDFPIGYPNYLSPECLHGYGERKQDVWATAIILIEQYTRNSFWTTSDVGLIFDSLMTLKEWYAEDPDIWHHAGIASLDINKTVLAFLQIKSQGEEEDFRQFILQCLEIDREKRLDTTQALGSDFFDKETLVAVESVDWVEGPILASDVIEPETINTKNSASQEDVHGILVGLPTAQVYNLWKLAGGDVELDLVKRGVFLSTPVIKRLPRVCIMPDGLEIGDKVNDTAQLYSDAIYVLGFKELYQRLEDGSKKGSPADTIEWDTDYFMLVDENDVNFLVEEGDQEKTKAMEVLDDSDENDLQFSDDVVSTSQDVPVPTTPSSSSRSLSRTVSMTGMGRSRSTSSISINSTASIPTQSTVPKPLFLREQDINYQYYRQTLFSELLRQYPASRKEIIHHAKVDIPPLLRGKVWAAVLGVRGDLNHAYDQINKCVDMGADRQVRDSNEFKK